MLARISQGSWGRISVRTSIGISGDELRLDGSDQGVAGMVEGREGELSNFSVGPCFNLIFLCTHHQLQLLVAQGGLTGMMLAVVAIGCEEWYIRRELEKRGEEGDEQVIQ